MRMQEIRFGIEIETILPRSKMAHAINSVVGGSVRHVGGVYDAWECTAIDGRKWKVVNDNSLSDAPYGSRAEIVSPILSYEDMNLLQEIVRAARREGAKVTRQCGCHVHIDASQFDGQKLANFAKIYYKQEELILHAFGVQEARLQRYTRPMNADFIRNLERIKPKTKDELNRIWYGYHNTNPQHYDQSRYQVVNFHNVWFRGTVEIRLFESTTHAGCIKSYVQFALALAAKALNSRAASSKRRDFNSNCAKYQFRCFLLSLGLIGDEFKTARYHLLKNMPGDAAWKNGRPQVAEAVN